MYCFFEEEFLVLLYGLLKIGEVSLRYSPFVSEVGQVLAGEMKA